MTDLPPGWEMASFGDVAEIASNLVSPAEYQGLPHIAPNHIEAKTGRLLAYHSVAEDGVTSSKHLFHPGQILYSKIRPYLAKATTVDFHGLCSADMYPINSWVDTNFLKWWILTPKFTESAIKHQGRSLLPKINSAALRQLSAPVPPLAEQHRIVAALEENFSRIQAGESALTDAQRRAKSIRYSAAHQATIGRLVDDSSSSGSTTDSRARSVQVDSLPEGWTVAPLGELSRNIQYGTSAKARADMHPRDIPVIRMGNIQDGKIRSTSLKYLPAGHPDLIKLTLRDGDVLFNRTNSAELVGKSAVYRESFGPATFASYLIRCQLSDDADPDWISLVINSPHGRGYISSVMSQQVGQANVNGKKLAAFPIPLPPIRQQRRLLAVYREICMDADRIDMRIETTRRSSERLRRSLLAEAFAGRLVPQDPDDEPASVLLERIRTERAAARKPKRARRTTKQKDTLL